MKTKNQTLALLIALAAGTLFSSPTLGTEARDLYVISDLHMGLGRMDAPPGEEGAWHPTEDFRWPRALTGFLAEISPGAEDDTVDLVIAGDFLELWQHPPEIDCKGPQEDPKNYGCTLSEMRRITERVLAAHSAELASLAAFAARGDNCLYIVPGNHDAALVLDPVWLLLEHELNPPIDGERRGCVVRAEDGIWVSADGRVVVEHGHQIGREANKYRDWPRITKLFGGTPYLERPWGEKFVQDKFNQEEAEYPLIDNLSPKSAGLRHRFAERGLGGTIADAARFVKFNLLDTSWRQKGAVLGKKNSKGQPAKWDVDEVRTQLGHRLFAGALPQSDSFRARLLDGTGEWAELRVELDQLAADATELPEHEVEALCDKLAIHGGTLRCAPAKLGAAAQRVFLERGRVVENHLAQRRRSARFKKTKVFAYGHTHELEHAWPAEIGRRKTIKVLNSGAFQRLLDEKGLNDLAAEAGVSKAEILHRGRLEALSPCYTVVQIQSRQRIRTSQVRAWIMEEDGEGTFGDPCSSLCPTIGDSCRERPEP